MKDQSKPKQTQIQKKASLDEASEYAENIINTVHEPLIILDHDLRVVSASRSFYEFFKVKPEETERQLIYNLGNKQWNIPKLRGLLETILPQKTTFDNYEVEHDFPTIGRRIILLNARQINRVLGKERIILLAIEDITERKRLENLLEEKYRTILEDIQEGYFEVDFAGNFTFFNDSLCRFLGYSKEELMGMNNRQYTDKEHSKKLFQAFNKVYNTGKPTEGFDWQIIRKDGTKRYAEASVSLQKDSSGKPTGFRGIARDVTDRKKVEEDLKASERKYRLLADNIHDVIFVLDMNLKYTYISPSVKILRGYEPEEILKQQSIEQTLTPSSQNLAMRTFSEIMELERSERRDINISRTLELEMRRKDGTTVWTEVKFSFIRDEDQRPVSIVGLTRDITECNQDEVKLQQTIDSLRKSVGATIQVMVSAVEMRDPYTAGHQIRVADIACAIAAEMGLPQDKIDGIRMAGSIHDIGKLSIPAEILSKPTNLTEIEFSLIKEHSRSGYEMLKNVESPWPLAQIVYQHHEWMDGSGYPRNLKGDEIIMEARIMAVADVVEAMASHRPYRPALGIDVALAEIEKNRGIFYDDAVADACLRLFREKGYQLIT